MPYLLFIFLITLSFISHADIYMQKDANGNIIYSDTPINKNAKRIETPTGNITSSTLPQQAPANNSPSTLMTQPGQTTPLMTVGTTRKPYTLFALRSPADQATIQNQPIIAVDININPDLQPGDLIQIYLDGNPWGKPLPSTHFEFTAPERGIHQISAKLFDKNGQLLKETPSNTVYIHQAHIGGSPTPLGPGI